MAANFPTLKRFSYKMSTILQLAYISAWRGILVRSPTSKVFLENQLGEITDGEKIELQKWCDLASNASIYSAWIQEDGSLPDVNVITRALAMKTGHQCLIPNGLLTSGVGVRLNCDSAGQRLALAYYVARGYSHEPMFQSLTDEQANIAQLGSCPMQNEPFRMIIRAGPGTGKTSTAVEMIRACVKSGQSVLLIAYTNSAVTTVRRRIGADPFLGNRYKSDPFSAKNAENKTRKPILLSTIDVIARAILTGGGNRPINAGLSFDEIVKNALAVTIADRRALDIFRDLDGTPLFTHLIVDETQMLSNDRAALARQITYGLSVSGINGVKSCHLTMFCDPKQAISTGAGQWLIDIYRTVHRTNGTNGVSDTNGTGTSTARTSASASAKTSQTATFEGREWALFDLTKSFRFATAEMLDFVMRISRKRPHLHVELTSGRSLTTTPYPTAYARSVADIATIVTDIAYMYHTTSSVGILTPTTGRTNKISAQVNAIILELRRRKIPVCTHEDHNYHANGVVVTTFNSCAGMEFSHVFICGVSGFPKTFPQIPAETGRSLMFVANSRAKISICYVVDKMELCVDVDNDQVRPMMQDQLETYTIPDQYNPKLPDFWTADLLFREGTGAKFMAANGLSYAKHTVLSRFDPGSKTALFEALSQYRINVVLVDGERSSGGNGAASGVDRSVHRLNPNIAHMRGLATRGKICITPFGGARVSDENGIPWAFELPDSDRVSGPRDLFYWFSNMRPEPFDSGTENRAIRLMSLLQTTLEKYDVENSSDPPDDSPGRYVPLLTAHEMKNPLFNEGHYLENYMVSSPDSKITIAGREALITYTSDPYVAMYMAALTYISKHAAVLAVQVDYTSGAVRIFDGFHAKMGYLLDALRRTHIYYMTTIFKQNFLGIPPEKRPPPNTFVLDTEYISRGNVLYEVGIVNLNDPFRSMCAILQNDSLTRAMIARMGLTPEGYKSFAIDPMEFALCFMETAGISATTGENQTGTTAAIPTLIYLSASQDVSWAKTLNSNDVNILTLLANEITKGGVFESDSKSSDLDTLYGAYVGTPNNSGRHRAFPDAVALAEIYIAHISKN